MTSQQIARFQQLIKCANADKIDALRDGDVFRADKCQAVEASLSAVLASLLELQQAAA